jgi:hypothetical protein
MHSRGYNTVSLFTVSDIERNKTGKQANRFDPIFRFLYYVELNCIADVSKKHVASTFRIEMMR